MSAHRYHSLSGAICLRVCACEPVRCLPDSSTRQFRAKEWSSDLGAPAAMYIVLKGYLRSRSRCYCTT